MPIVLVLVGLCAFVSASSGATMNGQYYVAASSGNPVQLPAAVAFRGDFIDVYSENISTVYGEVYWTVQDPIPLPGDFVQRFKDQVRKVKRPATY
jgi:hypothetical protein